MSNRASGLGVLESWSLGVSLLVPLPRNLRYAPIPLSSSAELRRFAPCLPFSPSPNPPFYHQKFNPVNNFHPKIRVTKSTRFLLNSNLSTNFKLPEDFVEKNSFCQPRKLPENSNVTDGTRVWVMKHIECGYNVIETLDLRAQSAPDPGSFKQSFDPESLHKRHAFTRKGMRRGFAISPGWFYA